MTKSTALPAAPLPKGYGTAKCFPPREKHPKNAAETAKLATDVIDICVPCKQNEEKQKCNVAYY